MMMGSAAPVGGISASTSPAECLEAAGRVVERMLHSDSQWPTLAEKLRIGPVATLGGLQESDYRSSSFTTSMRRVPLPAELVEHFGHMQCNCLMGLFPSVERAWLTIDSDIYVWRFEDGADLAYFDGLSDTILSVALLQPKKDIFQPQIKYLLCLTTAIEIVLLGVSFSRISEGNSDYFVDDIDPSSEMHLLPDPLFCLSTDSTYMQCVAGTASGRIFMGGKDGCLYEFSYKADDGWFGKKASKINHTSSSLSFLVPAFVSSALYEEDAIVQLAVDDSRNVMYARSEKGLVQMFDLGVDGTEMNKVTALTQAAILAQAAKIAPNIDKSNFSPIVGLSVIPSHESQPLCLLCTSANGVRFYFCAVTDSGQPLDRPRGLALQHVRLPPGFAASAQTSKPAKVHMTYYKNGTLLLSSGHTDDSDLLWVISTSSPTDLGPGSLSSLHSLSEVYTSLCLDGRVWAMDEVPQPRRLLRLYAGDGQNNAATNMLMHQQLPTAVVQHVQSPQRFVLLSALGAHIVTQLRPVDFLRKLLAESNGAESEVVRAFFVPAASAAGVMSMVDNDGGSAAAAAQACATALVLACSRAVQDAQVAEWATRAFFLHGGEPRLTYSAAAGRPPGLSSPPSGPTPATPFGPGPFMPYQTSTPGGHLLSPAGAAAQYGVLMPPEVHFSAKHNGLYLYFSRIVRPVWLTTLVVPTGGGADAPLASTVTGEELSWIVTQLSDLSAFLETSSAVVGGGMQGHGQHHHGLHHGHPHQQQQHQDALLRERQSLLFLQQLSSHCRQVLSLWGVVCDHQCHVVVRALSPDDRNVLRGMYFRDLILSASGTELCGRLVRAVVDRYLGDNASTDAISNRLRDVCPALYNADDAVAAKAHELIIGVRNGTAAGDDRQREHLLKEAVAMCKRVAASHRLNLEVLCGQLAAVHHFSGVLEICLAAAHRRDPQGLALHFYKSGEPPEDHQGMQAFSVRMSCYRHVLEMLRRLLDAGTAHPLSSNVPRTPGPPPPRDPTQLSPAEAASSAEAVLDLCLRSDDELFHVALYQWLVEHDRCERLLAVRSPFVEEFLVKGTKKHPEALVLFDLLWKYYEKTHSYAAAAKILSKLADRHSTAVSLLQRLEYLSRAIMSVKSGEMGGEWSRVSAGDLLHDLEEKMEVARVQLLILDAITAKQKAPVGGAGSFEALANAVVQLNADLLNISQLYQDFAEPYELWECQLAIFHTAGHHDQVLVETTWNQILDGEFTKNSDLPADSKVALITNKIKALGRLYSGSLKYFPLDFLVRKLELYSCQIKANLTWVFKALLGIGVSLPTVLEVYHRLYSTNDPVWLTNGSPNHLLHVLAKILDTFAESPSAVTYQERRAFTVQCQDAVGQYLGHLYTKHDSAGLVREFKGIQAKLDRL